MKKILLVDDEKSLTDILSEGLKMRGGYDIEQASNGREAVEKYKTFMPDLVIMDIEMPVMDGYDSSSRIKSFDPSAKILMLTGNPHDDRAHKIIKEGIALTILNKPVRLSELNRTIMENFSTLS